MATRLYVSTTEASFFNTNMMGCSNNPPSEGTFMVGDFLISTVQINGVFGWVCVEAGTPGVWKEICNISSINDNIEKNINDINELKNRVEVNENTLKELQTDSGVNIGNLGDSITNINNILNSHSSELSTLKNADNNINSDINEIKSNINKNTADITDLKTGHELQNKDIENLKISSNETKSLITSTQVDVNKNKSDLADLKANLGLNDKDLGNIQSSITKLENDLLALETDVDKNASDISGLKSDTNNDKNNLDSLKQGLIDALKEKDFIFDLNASWKDIFAGLLDVGIEEVVHCTDITLNTESIDFSGIGSSQVLNITLTPNDTNEDVIWKSSDPNVATVSNNGIITTVGEGSCVIYVICGDVSVSCNIKVTLPVTIIPCESVTLSEFTGEFNSIGTLQTLSATVSPSNTTDSVTWSSDNTTIATVVNGVVTAVGEGECTITAKCGNVKATREVIVNLPDKYSCTGITLNESQIELHATGETFAFTPKVMPEDCTDIIEWKSSNTAVATVNSAGVVNPVNIGECTITAKCGNYLSTCSVNVITRHVCTSISFIVEEITVGDHLVHPGYYLIPWVRVTPTFCTDRIFWSSDNTKVAIVNDFGFVSVVRAGECTITAKCGSCTATCRFVVTSN